MTTNSTRAEEFGVLPGGSSDARAHDLDVNDDSSKLARVRELLFGDESRSQGARVDSLEEHVAIELERIHEAMDSRIESMRREMRHEIESLASRLDAQGRDKVERKDMRALLSDLADRIGGDPPPADDAN